MVLLDSRGILVVTNKSRRPKAKAAKRAPLTGVKTALVFFTNRRMEVNARNSRTE